MDYKYIKQLLEHYWKCETSLEEENILRAFFSQKDVPAELLRYKDLFVYEQTEAKANVLSDDFDEKIMSIIEEPAHVKARTITMTQRLMPLFKAAAIVAIVLTLGNAAQVPFSSQDNNAGSISGIQKAQKGVSVAMNDSTVIDTIQQSGIKQIDNASANMLK